MSSTVHAGRTSKPLGSARRARAIGRMPGQLFLAVTMVAILFPIYWLLQSAFSTQADLYHTPTYLFPPHPSLEGFREAIPAVAPGLLHSVIIAVGTVLLTLFISAPTAYGVFLLRGRRGSAGMRVLVLSGLVFPSIMFVIPLYVILYRVHLLNTYPGLILADSLYSVPLGILILYNYMLTVPPALTEAAKVDGASLGRVFFSIVTPLTRPALATTAIFAFLAAWGDFLFAETFTSSGSITPASIGVYDFIGSGTTSVTSWPQVMAASVLLGVPALVAVFLAQRYIRTGLNAGAVAG